MTSFVPAPDWLEKVLGLTDVLFLTQIGPEIIADAQAACPVFGGQNSTASAESLAAAGSDNQPGSLLDSIEGHLNGHTLIVSATGSDERSYASFVDTGHRIVAWGHDTGEEKPPQPFLSSALYTVRLA